MSETIIGYINSATHADLMALENKIQRKTPFGFKFKDVLQLFNYPKNISVRSDLTQFVISDSRKSTTAAILLNEEDYDPNDELESEFQKAFPSMLKDRISEVTKIIQYLADEGFVEELGCSISVCDEIDEVKYISIESFNALVVKDCANSCPPNILYIINEM